MKRLNDSTSLRRKVHITEVSTVLILSLIPSIITISVTKYEYSDWFCIPQSSTVLFYNQILPEVVLYCVGLVLMFATLRILRRVS